MADDYILETEQLGMDFLGFVALKSVNLRVRRGSIHALIGPNGAGKTTFFNMLSRHIDPSEGRVTFAGRDITRLPPHALPAIGMARLVPALADAHGVGRGVLEQRVGPGHEIWVERVGRTVDGVAAGGRDDAHRVRSVHVAGRGHDHPDDGRLTTA